MGEPTELQRERVPMEDARVSYQILRLSAATRLSFHLGMEPPHVTKPRGKRAELKKSCDLTGSTANAVV